MINSSTTNEEKPVSPLYNRIVLWVLLILVAALVGGYFAVTAANKQYDREVEQWKIRLDTIADTRAANISEWTNRQLEELQSIASNLSVRLYLSEFMISAKNADVPQTDDGNIFDPSLNAAELVFLQNYLVATAKRIGYYEEETDEDGYTFGKVNGTSGVALLAANGRNVVATAGMPNLKGELRNFVLESDKAKVNIRNIYLGTDQVPSVAFLIPIFAVQADQSVSEQVGYILGVRRVDDSLYPFLTTPRTLEKTSESVLVVGEGDMVRYMSPLRDNSELFKSLKKSDHKKVASVQALAKPGVFFDEVKDYAGDVSMASVRSIAGTDWVLVHKIERDEALKPIKERRWIFIIACMLIILALLLTLLAVWRHSSSLRYKFLARKFKSQEGLLRLVTNNQPDAMFIVDKDGRYRFANEQASANTDINAEQMMGRQIRNVMDAKTAKDYEKICGNVLDNNEVETHIRRKEDGDNVKVIQSKYIPMEHIPIVLTDDNTSGTLVVEQDITDAILEKEKSERILQEIVDAMVSVVDSRDSYSANQSIRVSEVAKIIAKEIKLEPHMVETASIAGQLMNVGKVTLPIKLLTKKGKLTNDEFKEIKQSYFTGAEIVKDIEFSGPVYETIKQIQETVDGKGPLGLKGDDILITARIVALANAFVAMASPRAYREKLSREDITKIFMDDIGTKFDRKVVVAFISYLDNNNVTFDWESESAE